MLNDSQGDYLSSNKECKTSQMGFMRSIKKNLYIIAKSCRIAEIC